LATQAICLKLLSLKFYVWDAVSDNVESKQVTRRAREPIGFKHRITIPTATMTTISSLNTANALASLYDTGVTKTPAAANSASNATTSPSSTSVTLGQGLSITPVYGAPGTAPVDATQVWEGPSNNELSLVMAGNFAALSGAQQFQGLGALLLNQLGAGGGDFSQSVLLAGANASPTAIANAQSALHSSAANQVTLDVTTTSGAQVEISLDSGSNGLAVQISVTNGTLSASDRSALEGLSKAFQSAIDGLSSSNGATLDLSGLEQFDSSAISSIDFHASVQGASGTQTVDFHADSQIRKLSANGPEGSINLTVNMADTMILGNAEQQQNAISSYLQQFQNEQARGNGNAALMSMFEGAFTAMNSNYNVTAPDSALSALLSTMPAAGQGLMTGLADFTASVVQTPQISNPYRLDETDTFSFQASQTTEVDNDNPLNLSMTQQQSSHLTASFHKPLAGASGPLHLTSKADSQSYDYFKVNDSASSEAQVGFEKGALVKATLSHSASQSTRKQEFVKGQLTEDTTTPAEQSWSKDFLPLLDSAQLGGRFDSAQSVQRAQSTLQELNRLVVLQTNPQSVASSAQQTVV
jgi:hypothetical protein